MQVVVKLGGSLFGQELRAWVDVLASPGGGSRIVVPGGGRLADGVRALQAEKPVGLHFSDRCAHDMAILAMHQYGLVLAENLPGYERMVSVAGVVAATARPGAEGRRGVWLPDPHELACDSQIEASWDMTSDALSVWLAARAGVKTVVLVKSLSAEALNAPLPALVASGHVDPLCGQFGNQYGVKLRLMGVGEFAKLREILAAP